MSKKSQAAIELGSTLRNFMPESQRVVLLGQLRGEEGEGIAEIVLNVVEQIKATPKTYETDGQENKVAHLHYFRGGVDAWIVERDVGDDPRTGDGLGEQMQAYGFVTFTGHKEDAELGYVSIQDLIENNVELDLYWTPVGVRELFA